MGLKRQRIPNGQQKPLKHKERQKKRQSKQEGKQKKRQKKRQRMPKGTQKLLMYKERQRKQKGKQKEKQQMGMKIPRMQEILLKYKERQRRQKKEAEIKATEDAKNTKRYSEEVTEAQMDTKEKPLPVRGESNRMSAEEAKNTSTQFEEAPGSTNKEDAEDSEDLDLDFASQDLTKGNTEDEAEKETSEKDVKNIHGFNADHEKNRWSADVNYDHETEKQIEKTEKNEEVHVKEGAIAKEGAEKISNEIIKLPPFDSENEEEEEMKNPEEENQDFMKGSDSVQKLDKSAKGGTNKEKSGENKCKSEDEQETGDQEIEEATEENESSESEKVENDKRALEA